MFKLIGIALAFVCCNAFAEPIRQTLSNLRALPEPQRIAEFSKLDNKTKIELFYQATDVHPPYQGLNDAMARQGKGFILKLRNALEEKGGTPEILNFLLIVHSMKLDGMLKPNDIHDLHMDAMCGKIPISHYCPELLREILQ